MVHKAIFVLASLVSAYSVVIGWGLFVQSIRIINGPDCSQDECHCRPTSVTAPGGAKQPGYPDVNGCAGEKKSTFYNGRGYYDAKGAPECLKALVRRACPDLSCVVGDWDAVHTCPDSSFSYQLAAYGTGYLNSSTFTCPTDGCEVVTNHADTVLIDIYGGDCTAAEPRHQTFLRPTLDFVCRHRELARLGSPYGYFVVQLILALVNVLIFRSLIGTLIMVSAFRSSDKDDLHKQAAWLGNSSNFDHPLVFLAFIVRPALFDAIHRESQSPYPRALLLKVCRENVAGLLVPILLFGTDFFAISQLVASAVTLCYNLYLIRQSYQRADGQTANAAP